MLSFPNKSNPDDPLRPASGPGCFAPVWVVCLLACVCLLSLPAEADDKPIAVIREAPITEDDRNHWSFQPLRSAPIPAVKNLRWPRNAIDRFVLARLEEQGLEPQPAAQRSTLARRLSFDILGLPPSREQMDRFLNDKSPLAYERLVDRLLSSPHYGERWGQHWLDVARFAETDGFEHDKLRPQAWRYRDWVIRQLNADLPYDRFVQLQLAGDEIQPQSAAARIATTFCLAGPDMPDINSQEERRHNLLNELTGTVGQVFLALQMGCCQCHDHKYDPISQADFYRLRAIFEPAVSVRRNKSVSVLSESRRGTADNRLMIRGDWRRPGPTLSPAYPRIANPGKTTFVAADTPRSSGRRTALARWITRPSHPLTSRVMVNRIWQHHFGRGLSATPNDFGLVGLEPSHPLLLDWLALRLVRSQWSLKAIHREILCSATYRQLSQLQATADPSLIAAWKKAARTDPENEGWWRFPRRRLEGEIIRDAMLSVAGVLNNKQGGPGVRPPLSKELVATLLRNQWVTTKDRAEHDRRSVYVFARRNLRLPIFDAFDRPDANRSCGRRTRSTTAPQSLLMINSSFSFDIARRLAGRVLAEDKATTLDKKIDLLVELCFARTPSPRDRKAFRSFVEGQEKYLRNSHRTPATLTTPEPAAPQVDPYRAAAFADLCLAVINLNEFIYID